MLQQAIVRGKKDAVKENVKKIRIIQAHHCTTLMPESAMK
jgi:hypothetical protein